MTTAIAGGYWKMLKNVGAKHYYIKGLLLLDVKVVDLKVQEK